MACFLVIFWYFGGMTRLELEIELNRLAAENPKMANVLHKAALIVHNSRIQLEGEQRPTAYEAGYKAGVGDYPEKLWALRDEIMELKRQRRKAQSKSMA
jgi:hypothetical protein